MKIIPAIDIMDKRVVRLLRGEFDKEKIYSENPVLIAKKWQDEGATLIHLVDLDGARLGKPVNLDVVRSLAKSVSIDIELGGGLRTENDIEAALEAGAHYVVIGTSAVLDKIFCENLIQKYKDKVIFAADIKEGKVAVKGWKEVSGEDPIEYLKGLRELGAKRVIYTDISRDGMMSGPNLDALRNVLTATSFKVIASGGISSVEDIKKLKELEPAGLEGVIVGKALYENKISLKEAISVS